MGDEVGRTTAWYYCLRHRTVEPEGVCKATDRLGPYPDPDAAAHALETFREREERLEAEDRQWAEGAGAESDTGPVRGGDTGPVRGSGPAAG